MQMPHMFFLIRWRSLLHKAASAPGRGLTTCIEQRKGQQGAPRAQAMGAGYVWSYASAHHIPAPLSQQQTAWGGACCLARCTHSDTGPRSIN